MFVIGNFLLAISVIVDAALGIYWWIVVASAVLSWVNPDPYNPIVRFLRSATEPVYYRIRRVLPLTFGGVDFSPIVLLLGIQFLQIFLVPTLRQMALQAGAQPFRAY
ncbi:YggT family protein [bacterium]|nr:YggT family protein [bacterium]